jgi:hypothetical protein
MYLKNTALYALKGHNSKELKIRTINNINDGLEETQNSETRVRELKESPKIIRWKEKER